jgi:hypothetical protein
MSNDRTGKKLDITLFPLWAQETGLVVERCCFRLDNGTEWAEVIHVFGRTIRIESHLSPQPHVTIHYVDH